MPRDSTPDAAKSLDSLFDRLLKAEDQEEAKGIANLIERRWLRSSSDVADLLMTRALTVMQPKDQDLPQAVELLDRVIGLEPQWAEAYNKRATAFFLLGDYQRSMLDVRQALSREPRHYGALSGLGQILLVTGDKKRALEAFRRAMAINPRLQNIKEIVDKLAPDVDGRDTWSRFGVARLATALIWLFVAIVALLAGGFALTRIDSSRIAARIKPAVAAK